MLVDESLRLALVSLLDNVHLISQCYHLGLEQWLELVFLIFESVKWGVDDVFKCCLCLVMDGDLLLHLGMDVVVKLGIKLVLEVFVSLSKHIIK